jgi:hypothetical protein
MSSTFREQLDQRFRELLDVLGPDEMMSFVQQVKADLGNGNATSDEEATRRLEKFEGTFAHLQLRAIDKLLESLQRSLNTVYFADPSARRGQEPND